MNKSVWITAYDMSTTKTAVAAGADVLLVGDSLGNVVYGFDRTSSVTVGLMVPHVASVVRFANGTRVVADMPFGADADPVTALKTAEQFNQVGTTHVKVEGLKYESIQALIENGYTVTGHLGLLPQTAKKLGKVATTEMAQAQLKKEALILQELGVSEIVLECVPTDFAAQLQTELSVDIIGIGSGKHTNGQVLVWHDVVGLTQNPPPFAKPFGSGFLEMKTSIEKYINSVKNG